MRAFLDTSVLIATFYGDHEHHTESLNLFLRFDKKDACGSGYSLAEVYSVLTGMPGRSRVSGDEALLFLTNVRERLTLITLNDQEYFDAVESAAAAKVVGGGIYDALLGHCALKVNAERIFTWNVKHFKCLSPEIGARVTMP